MAGEQQLNETDGTQPPVIESPSLQERLSGGSSGQVVASVDVESPLLLKALLQRLNETTSGDRDSEIKLYECLKEELRRDRLSDQAIEDQRQESNRKWHSAMEAEKLEGRKLDAEQETLRLRDSLKYRNDFLVKATLPVLGMFVMLLGIGLWLLNMPELGTVVLGYGVKMCGDARKQK
ncbi:MAG: hypothetical protein QOJ65_1670 [Fimbriimonadaceae bacterium]|jgi:hypothetical protein|nr:hypothetical protein [Fimbriimonadaceae bacterium]